LPSFSRRARAVVVVMAAISAAYSAVNHFHLRAPILLPLSFLDKSVPYSPWAMPVYLSHFLFLPVALLSLRSYPVFLRALKAMSIAATLACVIFFLYPTTFPRMESSGFWFGFLHFIDTPANCFPSLHVALASIAAWSLREDGIPWAPFGALWALSIALSTMLVKQHYAADVLGGLLLASSAVFLVSRASLASIPAGEPA
jgi:membrane-associated phospholipid phosphatase